jgi:predicted Zn finger-like uncharacterized protein
MVFFGTMSARVAQRLWPATRLPLHGARGVKFLCDRCKTRYSIGDDRVRGKILKIRCKNCANVITVREGMDADGADDPGRRKSPTTNAPLAVSSASANVALSAAFAKQMAKPPPALEEEWYVSMDGNQAGPFSLAEAQRWVAAKPYEAELHCWSEGFDDWLPVDKVSHFRGLRKKAQQAPPPVPRLTPRLQAVEENPKPLFAATMAVLEKGSGAVRVPAAASVPAPAATPAAAASSMQAKTNGAGASAPGFAKGNSGPIGSIAPTTTKSGANRGSAAPALAPGAKVLATAFDVHDEEPRTSIDEAAFPDNLAPSASKPQAVPTPIETRGARKLEPRSESDSDDDQLDIGEVSRVVSLGDLAKHLGEPAPRKHTPRAPMLRTPAASSRPSVPTFSGSPMTPGAFGLTGPFQMLDGPVPSESVVARAPVEASRRGMIILLVAAALLLAGVLAAVVLIVTSGNDDVESGTLGHTREIDTTRPEDIVRRIAIQATGSGSGGGPSRSNRHIQLPGRPGGAVEPEITDPTKRALESDEVQDMAAKQSDGTNFCYKRAQRGAIGIEIADLKRLDVTLTIDKEGAVNDVQLSSHAGDTFGMCVTARIKGWKFRQSSGTKTFRFALVFAH